MKTCQCCGQEIKQKPSGVCGHCGNDTYTKVSEDDPQYENTIVGKHTYRCKQCGTDWWCFFFRLADDGEHLVKRFNDKGKEI